MGTLIDASVAAGVQAAIAAYAQALDANRPEDIADLFTADGVSEIAGMATFEGRDAIRTGYVGFAPTQPQLHLVANTVITQTEDGAIARSDLAFIQRGEAGWAVQLVGSYDDVLRLDDGQWRFQRRVTSFRQ